MSELNVPGFIAFLRGEVTLDGRWFGDEGPIESGIRRAFWWRKYLPQLLGFIERKDEQIESLRAQLAEAQAAIDAMTRESVAHAQEAGELAAKLSEAQARLALHEDIVAALKDAHAYMPLGAERARIADVIATTAVKKSLTTGATDSVPEGYALVEVGILSDRCLAVAMRDAAIVSKATNGDSTAVATATIHAYLLAASGRWGGK